MRHAHHLRLVQHARPIDTRDILILYRDTLCSLGSILSHILHATQPMHDVMIQNDCERYETTSARRLPALVEVLETTGPRLDLRMRHDLLRTEPSDFETFQRCRTGQRDVS